MIELTDSTNKLDSISLQTLHQKLHDIVETLQAITISHAPSSQELMHARIHLERTAPLLQKDIEVILVCQEDMRTLNLESMGKDYATDVLSFPLAPLDMPKQDPTSLDHKASATSAIATASHIPESKKSPQPPPIPLGSIVINLPLATSISDERTHSLCDELCLLFLHGLLHLLGFDHESDNGEQRALESMLLSALALPSSLIDRTLMPPISTQ